MNFTDEQKLKSLKNIATGTLESVNSGIDVTLLLSDGIPTVLDVYNDYEEFNAMITYPTPDYY